MKRKALFTAFAVMFSLLIAHSVFAAEDADQNGRILPQLPATPTLPVSTVPANGDLNPYGVAFVPRDFPRGGPLRPGDVLVANFNAASNLQGTGTTIVRVRLDGTQKLFFQGDLGLGLSTALGVLKSGFVIVGNVPSTGGLGTCTEDKDGDHESGVEHGSLIILDRFGNVVKTLKSDKFLDGPWDLTIRDSGDHASVFVSDVESGTVTRVDLKIRDGFDWDKDRLEVEGMTQIASGYVHRCDPAAFVVGPTGLALDEDKDVLYVASTGDNAIYSIRDASDTGRDAGKGDLVVQDSVHLHGPLGLVRSPNGDLITSQGDAVNPDPNQVSEIVEFTNHGHFVAEFEADPNAGSAFGLALEPNEDGFVFAAVDDFTNVLDFWIVY